MNPPELFHNKERQRLQALEALQVLDTPLEERFDRITRLARRVFDVPFCAISCIDEHRQWFKSIQGSSTTQTARCVSFCQHTILQDESFVIEDARVDPRFRGTPLVDGDARVVFYAGVPMYGANQLPVAAFCIVDHQPRTISADQLTMLKDFAMIAQHTLWTPGSNALQDRMIHEVDASWRRSLIDPLTRLWNIEGISALLEESINPANNKKGLLLAVVDPRGIKQINADVGHDRCNEILSDFVRGLPRVLGSDAVVGRLGSDKFLVIQSSPESMDNTYPVLHAIHNYADSFEIPDVLEKSTLGATVAALHVPAGWDGDVKALSAQLTHRLEEAKRGPDRSPARALPAEKPGADPRSNAA